MNSLASTCFNMAKKLEQLMADLPQKRRVAIEARAGKLATLKDLRQAAQQTQHELAAALGEGHTCPRHMPPCPWHPFSSYALIPETCLTQRNTDPLAWLCRRRSK
jgi:hypothetical protein